MPWPNTNYRRKCNLVNRCGTKSIMVGRHGGGRLGIRQKSLIVRQTDRMRDHRQEGWLLSHPSHLSFLLLKTMALWGFSPAHRPLLMNWLNKFKAGSECLYNNCGPISHRSHISSKWHSGQPWVRGGNSSESQPCRRERNFGFPKPSLCFAECLFFLYVCYMCVFPHCPTPNNINTFLHLLILFAVLEIFPLLPVALEIFHAF